LMEAQAPELIGARHGEWAPEKHPRRHTRERAALDDYLGWQRRPRYATKLNPGDAGDRNGTDVVVGANPLTGLRDLLRTVRGEP
jgi:hypothetical protein